MNQRQSGRTTSQIIGAPEAAIFVWCNNRIEYAKALALRLNRTDLKVMPLSWLDPFRLAGLRPSAVVVDHAVPLTGAAADGIAYLLSRGSTLYGVEAKN